MQRPFTPKYYRNINFTTKLAEKIGPFTFIIVFIFVQCITSHAKKKFSVHVTTKKTCSQFKYLHYTEPKILKRTHYRWPINIMYILYQSCDLLTEGRKTNSFDWLMFVIKP